MKLYFLTLITLLSQLSGEILDVNEVTKELTEASYDSSRCYELTAKPFISKNKSQFGANIEGASVDKHGNVYATNYGTSDTKFQIGQVYPTQKLLYKDNNADAYLNGVRVLNGEFYVADAVKHRVLKLSTNKSNNGTLKSQVFCSDSNMIQPNDLTISKSGIVFTSGGRYGPNTGNTNGDVWVCTPDGKVVKRFDLMGRTNGVELSLDDKYLFVSESYTKDGTPNQQKIWKYEIDYNNYTFKSKKLFIDFANVDGSISNDIDGIRFDSRGNLFVARHSGKQIVVFDKNGKVISRIRLSFPRPTNIEFGGKDGKQLFITGQCPEDTQPEVGNGCVDTLNWFFKGSSYVKQQ